MKKIIQLYWRNSILQFLVSYILILVFPLFIISFGFQKAFQIVESDLKDSQIDMLGHSADIIGNQLRTMENMALQTSQDSDIQAFADVKRGDKGYILTAMGALDNFSMYGNYQNMELLGDAYIYFQGMDLVLYEGTYYQPEIFHKYLGTWGITEEEWQTNTISPAIWYPEYHKSGDSFEYVFPFSRGLNGENKGVIVYRMNKRVLEQMFDFENFYRNDGVMLQILDQNKETLWTSNTMEMTPDIHMETLHENEFQAQKGMGVVSVRDSRLNWNYVLAVPEKMAMYQLGLLKTMVTVLSVVAVLGGIAYSVLMAVWKGRPINEVFRILSANGGESYTYQNLGTAVTKLVTNHQEVLENLEKERPFMQVAFFQDLLQAEYGNEEQIRLAARKAGIKIEGQVCQVALFQIFSGNDIHMVDEQTLNEVHVISKLLEDYLSEHWQRNVWFHKRNYKTVMAIFGLNDIGEDCRQMIENSREWMKTECQVEVSWGIGEPCEDLTLIWRSLEEARIALEHVSQQYPVVCYNSSLVNTEEYYLPQVAKERLTDAIRSGQRREMDELLELLERENCANRQLNRSQFLKLSRELVDVLASVQKSEPAVTEGVISLNEVLMASEIPKQEYFSRYRQLCRMICSENGEKKRIRKGQLIEEIMDYLKEHYSDADLGLAKVGTLYQLSEGYLSGVFKEQAGVNFADFLEQVRIKKASELLLDKSLTVNQVSEQVGYNSVQSFRRAFKRVRGISPKEARGL